ncbi:hypothetical protein LCGC14_0536100 [marine sediment metagenome]|uniref:Uncharacterized protein n=1 Tax=marine sediment metagenome TaxID=412755 RepID=A0A0F9V2B7_9ZZZZ
MFGKDKTEDKLWDDAFEKVNPTTPEGKLIQRITQNFNAEMEAASQEYERDKRALEIAYITDAEFQSGMTELHRKHTFNASKLRKTFERRLRLGLE